MPKLIGVEMEGGGVTAVRGRRGVGAELAVEVPGVRGRRGGRCPSDRRRLPRRGRRRRGALLGIEAVKLADAVEVPGVEALALDVLFLAAAGDGVGALLATRAVRALRGA
jgi:hypothetical protein